MLSRRCSERFISNESEIVALEELVHPIIHRAHDSAYAESSVAQHFTRTFLPKVDRSVWIAPRDLQIKRDEAIAWVSRQQNDFCPTKLPSRHEIFAAQPVP